MGELPGTIVVPDAQEISGREVGRLFPAARVDDVVAGFYVADDGRVNPVDVTRSLAAGARARGVRILEGLSVSGVLKTPGGRVAGVTTSAGDIRADVVVNAAGMWARQASGGDG